MPIRFLLHCLTFFLLVIGVVVVVFIVVIMFTFFPWSFSFSCIVVFLYRIYFCLFIYHRFVINQHKSTKYVVRGRETKRTKQFIEIHGSMKQTVKRRKIAWKKCFIYCAGAHTHNCSHWEILGVQFGFYLFTIYLERNTTNKLKWQQAITALVLPCTHMYSIFQCETTK